jgi:hypothetical protein
MPAPSIGTRSCTALMISMEVLLPTISWICGILPSVSISLLEKKNLSDEELVDVIDAMSAQYLERMCHFVTHKPSIAEKLTQHNTYGELQDFLKIIKHEYTRDKMPDKWCPKRHRQFTPPGLIPR